MAVFSAGVILLLNIWGGKRTGATNTDPAKEMADVHKAMKMLKSLETRFGFILQLIFLSDLYCSDGTLPEDYGMLAFSGYAMLQKLTVLQGYYLRTCQRRRATSSPT